MRKEHDFSIGKRGAVLSSSGKTWITIMLDDDVIEHFRAQAETRRVGYQTMINAARRAAISRPKVSPADDRPLTVSTLRKILWEELRAS